MKKFVIFFGVLFSILVFTALPSFALDAPLESYDFTLSDYPMHSMEHSANIDSFAYFFQNTDYEVFYIEVFLSKNTGSRPVNFEDNQFLSAGSFANGNNFNFLPFCYMSQTFGNYSINPSCTIYVYDVEGNLVTFTPYYSWHGNTQFAPLGTNWLNNGTDVSRYYECLHGLDYFPVELPRTYAGANGYVINNVPQNSPVYVMPGIDVLNGDVYASTIQGAITVNGVYVYGNSNEDNTATHIIGSGIGSFTPVYDGSGNITSYDIQQNFDLTIPEPSGDADIVELPSNPSVPQADTSSFTALEWIVNFIDTVCRHNSKIFAVIILSLTIGLSTLILNKRR